MLQALDHPKTDCPDHPLEPQTVAYYESIISEFSHDFRGQLSSLLLNLHLLERQSELQSDEKVLRLKAAINELNELVSHMREASHPCEKD